MGAPAPPAPGQVALARLVLLEACAAGYELNALFTAQGSRNAGSALKMRESRGSGGQNAQCMVCRELLIY